MTRVELLVMFQDIFHVKNEIEDWFPNGNNSIRIRLKETNMLPFAIGKGDELIFTAKSRSEWRLETMESWIKTMSDIIAKSNEEKE